MRPAKTTAPGQNYSVGDLDSQSIPFKQPRRKEKVNCDVQPDLVHLTTTSPMVLYLLYKYYTKKFINVALFIVLKNMLCL